MEVKDMLVWAAQEGMTREQLEYRIEQAQDDINDALHMIQAATARLAVMEAESAPRMVRQRESSGKVIRIARRA